VAAGLDGDPGRLLASSDQGLAPETTLTSFNRFCVKFLMLPEPLLVLVQFRPGGMVILPEASDAGTKRSF
jgi:hypothetical protein